MPTTPRTTRRQGGGGNELRWTRAGSRRPRAFTLARGDANVATLTWVRSGGSLAVAQADSHRWTFKRVGFFSPRVTVRREGSDVDLAVFHPAWGDGGALRFADGRELRWGRRSFWQGGHVWSADGKDVMTLTPSGILGHAATVTLHGARWSPDAALLASLGWYLSVLAADDAAAGAAVIMS